MIPFASLLASMEASTFVKPRLPRSFVADVDLQGAGTARMFRGARS